MGIGLQQDGEALIDEFGKFPLVVGSDIIFDGGQISRVWAATDMLLESYGRCIFALSSPFQGFVATVCAQGDAKGFTLERTVTMASKTTLLSFTRGTPAWNLPEADPSEPESHTAVAEDNQHRAELLFA